MLKGYIIQPADDDFESLTLFAGLLEQIDFEHLIELFEFVISPSEKVVNGAIYTPSYIRDYIAENTLQMYMGQLNDIKAVDPSCGCGGFLLTLAILINKELGKSFAEIFRENIYGIDIAEYSTQRARLLLSLYAVINGEDVLQFDFNLQTDNSLTFNWRANCPEIEANDGFDIVVGNPPYVCSRNMDSQTLDLIKGLDVCRTGHPDLYIPFFQIGLEQLNAYGVLGYITVNTFIKSVNGRALRAYFHDHDVNITLLNFGGEQIFKNRNTYTCICFLRYGAGRVNYLRTPASGLKGIDFSALHRFSYSDLNHNDGWNLLNDQASIDFVSKIESTGEPFKLLYNTKNGIATLKNDVYKFSPIRSDDQNHFMEDNGRIFPIERSICRRIVNANKVKCHADIERIVEQIIFPYTFDLKIIAEDTMERDFPNAYAYLRTKMAVLATRDKGARSYEAWYAYGRRQSMDINAFKLFFPHICDRPKFVICEEQDLLFYNGIALVTQDLEELHVIKKLLESDLFFRYIRYSTKDYASGYISMSRNHLKNFGVFQFTYEQKTQLLLTDDVEHFLEDLYGIKSTV